MDVSAADRITVVDITDESTYRLIPPCADPGFDHRSCDYWEDADRGSKAIRLDWLEPPRPAETEVEVRPKPANPFLADLEARTANPFAVPGGGLGDGAANPFAPGGTGEAENPF